MGLLTIHVIHLLILHRKEISSKVKSRDLFADVILVILILRQGGCRGNNCRGFEEGGVRNDVFINQGTKLCSAHFNPLAFWAKLSTFSSFKVLGKNASL